MFNRFLRDLGLKHTKRLNIENSGPPTSKTTQLKVEMPRWEDHHGKIFKLWLFNYLKQIKEILCNYGYVEDRQKTRQYFGMGGVNCVPHIGALKIKNQIQHLLR